ncbi:methionine--tRNA ligase [Salinibacterium sp. PAMC 21357]|uniref:methionine--tRNA ligase n=1 Tax=Salinibacterium sp. PAMC 21357 TaxID=1112215 RepID=UPI000288616A|nr:methionine--tRNA ligase [Salinibacterium sp. PAMC 21357]
MSAGDSFYIATPIFYVNDVPHIGHAYTEVAADVLARWHRQRGEDAWLLTGTDEHGQKILRTAVANNTTPQEWADRLVADSWQPLLETIDIANDDFIRTTDERHEKAVATFLQRLYDDGHIYAGEYEGYYCVGCEEYKQLDDLVTAPDGDYKGQLVCAIHSRPVEILKEKNYFFRMSDFGQKLLDLYESQPNFVQPASVRNEIIQFVKQGLDDLSISRSSFDWGVKVPWDESHVVYVWFDALLNYISAIGYGVDDEQFAKRWPAVQLVGKDIARFHAVIWPAMLMAADLPVPRAVFGHGWLLVGGEKMSKSKLTGIAPSQITDTFGSDAFRYYFMSAITFGQDGSFSWEDLSARYQAELANGFGNLASRVIAMVNKYFDGEIPTLGELTTSDEAIIATQKRATENSNAFIDKFAINDALSSVWQLVDELNGYITEQEPWALSKDPANRERLGTVLATTVNGLGTLAILLSPVLPKATHKLWTAIGGVGELREQRIDDARNWSHSGRVTALESSLFPRIEVDAESGTA